MPGKFLNLTFHGGTLAAEDLRFKEEVGKLTSGLKSTDAMDETDAKQFFADHADELKATKSDKFSGVAVVKRSATTLITLNGLGPVAWGRKGYLKTFEEWMKKVMATPVDVLVLAGHHSNSYVWGAAPRGTHRYFTAFHPVRRNDGTWRLQVVGHQGAAGPLLRTEFDVTKTLKSCRLMILLGCNGATTDIAAWRGLLRNASGGDVPHIFGWYQVHSYPHEGEAHFLSQKLWTKLEALAPGAGAAKNFAFLQDVSMREKVRNLWRDVLAESFPKGSFRRHLFVSPFLSSGERGPRGGGVVDPEGKIWQINTQGNLEHKEDVE